MFLRDVTQGQTTVACVCDRCERAGQAQNVLHGADETSARLLARRGFRLIVEGGIARDICTDCMPTSPMAPAADPVVNRRHYSPREFTMLIEAIELAVDGECEGRL